MHALLHTLGAIVVLPYVALALFFVFVGEVARSKGMVALVDTILNNFYFYITKGMFIAPILWVFLVVAGFLPSFQRAGSICLALTAVASLIVIVLMRSSPLEFGDLFFPIPCLAVAVLSIWLFFRTNAAHP
jgi:hypothetical protein